MRITRIEIDGKAGHVAIERKRGSATIRIDSTIRDPRIGQEAWHSWELPAGINRDDLFKVAQEIQGRCDGQRGTNSMIHDYLHELDRFTD